MSQEKDIQDKIQELTHSFMMAMNMEISQIEKNGESNTKALRDSLTFLDLMKYEFIRSVENKKRELLQSRKTKQKEKESWQ